MKVHAIQTGTVAVKTRQREGLGGESTAWRTRFSIGNGRIRCRSWPGRSSTPKA